MKAYIFKSKLQLQRHLDLALKSALVKILPRIALFSLKIKNQGLRVVAYRQTTLSLPLGGTLSRVFIPKQPKCCRRNLSFL